MFPTSGFGKAIEDGNNFYERIILLSKEMSSADLLSLVREAAKKKQLAQI
jgi:hypothetical protein